MAAYSSQMYATHLCSAAFRRNRSVGIATRYGQDGPGIESQWWRYFPHPPIPALGHTQPPIQWAWGLLPRGKAAWAWRWPPTPLYAFMACSRANFTVFYTFVRLADLPPTPLRISEHKHCSAPSRPKSEHLSVLPLSVTPWVSSLNILDGRPLNVALGIQREVWTLRIRTQ